MGGAPIGNGLYMQDEQSFLGTKFKNYKTKMRRQISIIWQGITTVILGLLSYLLDCFLAHASHLDVPWIQSGLYFGWPFGISITVIMLLTGCYLFLKGIYESGNQ